jgi:hypothetical protein
MKKIGLAGLVAMAALFSGAAHADKIYWSLGINAPAVGTVISNAPPVYMAAPPVVYAPQPQVIYQRPRPIYIVPPQVVYQPPVVVYGQGGWGGSYHHRHRGRDHHRGEQWGGYREDRSEYRYRY